HHCASSLLSRAGDTPHRPSLPTTTLFRSDEAPALAHRRHGRLVERREAGGADHAHIRRTPVGRDQDLEEADALLPEPARHQRVRRARARARRAPRPPPARAPRPPPAAPPPPPRRP